MSPVDSFHKSDGHKPSVRGCTLPQDKLGTFGRETTRLQTQNHGHPIRVLPHSNIRPPSLNRGNRKCFFSTQTSKGLPQFHHYDWWCLYWLSIKFKAEMKSDLAIKSVRLFPFHHHYWLAFNLLRHALFCLRMKPRGFDNRLSHHSFTQDGALDGPSIIFL